MKLLEYEAKELLKTTGAAVPESQIFTIGNDLTKLPLPVVLKVQIPIGGRGKAGGIKVAKTLDELSQITTELLNNPIKGYQATTLLAEEVISIKKELYLSLLIDRSLQSIVLLAHKDGGIDIEAATEQDSNSLLRIPLDSSPDSAVISQLLTLYSLDESMREPLEQIVDSLWRAFTKNDALLLEINPLVVDENDRLLCADAKMELDDSAAFRHDNWQFETPMTSSQFVTLNDNGNVACMANGAGLAMATVDAIAAAGAIPANFLDIGGGTNTEGMVKAFDRITAMKSVQAIIINVFAGITRCDEVAEAIVIAKDRFAHLPPLFIRLAGTNEKQGKDILRSRDIATLDTLSDCVNSAIQEVSHA